MSRPPRRRGARPWDPERVEVVLGEIREEPPLRLDAVPGHVTLQLDPEGAERLARMLEALAPASRRSRVDDLLALDEAALAASRCAWCRSYPYHRGRCQRCGHPEGGETTCATLRPCAAEPVGDAAVSARVAAAHRRRMEALMMNDPVAAREVAEALSAALRLALAACEILGVGPRASERRETDPSHCARAGSVRQLGPRAWRFET